MRHILTPLLTAAICLCSLNASVLDITYNLREYGEQLRKNIAAQSGGSTRISNTSITDLDGLILHIARIESVLSTCIREDYNDVRKAIAKELPQFYENALFDLQHALEEIIKPHINLEDLVQFRDIITRLMSITIPVHGIEHHVMCKAVFIYFMELYKLILYQLASHSAVKSIDQAFIINLQETLNATTLSDSEREILHSDCDALREHCKVFTKWALKHRSARNTESDFYWGTLWFWTPPLLAAGAAVATGVCVFVKYSAHTAQ